MSSSTWMKNSVRQLSIASWNAALNGATSLMEYIGNRSGCASSAFRQNSYAGSPTDNTKTLVRGIFPSPGGGFGWVPAAGTRCAEAPRPISAGSTPHSLCSTGYSHAPMRFTSVMRLISALMAPVLLIEISVCHSSRSEFERVRP